jgi:hypothetical protein
MKGWAAGKRWLDKCPWMVRVLSFVLMTTHNANAHSLTGSIIILGRGPGHGNDV